MPKIKPAPLRERDITRQIAREYYREFDQLIESDVIVVGAGPSGLVCARDLAGMGFRTLVVEQALALGGGFWSGGYLMNKATICAPANEILEELGVPCSQVKDCEGMYMVDPPHATGALIAACYKAGVKVMNLTRVVDLILRRDGVLEGVVVNNTTAEMAGHDVIHVDPIALESRVVVDATGHDAVVVSLLHRRNLYKPVPGNGAMWVSRSEEQVMEHTGEVYPNCFVVGLAVAAVYGTPRMGPAFGSMLLSGRQPLAISHKPSALHMDIQDFLVQGEGREEDKKEAWNYFQQAYEHQMKGQLEEAVNLYKRSIEAHPTAEAYTFLGWTYSFMGKLDEAIEECHRAIEVDPDFGNPYNDIGAYLIEKGQFDEAVPWFERAMQAKRYESPAFPQLNLGRVYERKGEWQQAIECYKRALALNPNYLLAKRALARLISMMN